MKAGKPSRRFALKRFVVAEASMLPALRPGDGLLAWRSGRARQGQLRVFEHPRRPGFWLVKRVGSVVGDRFEAVSDNPASGAVDSRVFGPVVVEGSYRVLLRVPGPSRNAGSTSGTGK